MYFVVGISRFQKWFDVDVLDLQVKPKKTKYILFEKLGDFFKSSGHPG
jgi:hypothetical protein